MKKWRARLLILAGVAFLGIALLPQLISARWIYQPLLERFAKDDFRFDVATMRLYWFSPVVLEGIAVKQVDGPSLVAIEQVKTDRGLVGFILGGRNVGRLEVVNPVVDIEFLDKGTNVGKLISALSGAKDENKAKKKLELDVQVAVRGLRGIVHQQGAEKPLVVVPPFNADLTFHAAADGSLVHVEPTQVLDHVQLTPELMEFGMKFILPLLAQSAWIEGRVSLQTGVIEVPLEKLKESTGTAVVTLHQIRSGVTQPAIVKVIDLVANLMDREPSHEFALMDESQVKVQMADQWVSHEGLQVGLPKIDPRLQISSSGRVGLGAGELDLTLEIPVPLAYLARREAVREIGVPTLSVPVKGTLREPVIEWSALRQDSADLLGLIQKTIVEEAPAAAAVVGALEGLAGGEADQTLQAAAQLLKGFRERRAAKEKEKEAAMSSESQDKTGTPKEPPPNTETAPKRPVRDLFKKLLKDKPDEAKEKP